MKKLYKSSKAGNSQQGFTLIELIVVIVVIGILGATAIPRLTNVSSDARMAKLQSARGAILSAATMYHGRWMVAGGLADNSTIDSVNMNATGYPTNGGMQVAVNLSDYDTSTMTNTGLLAVDINHPKCAITYTKATGTVSALPAQGQCD